MGCTSCNSSSIKKTNCKNSNTCTRCNKFSVFDWLGNIKVASNKKTCSIVEVSFKNGRKNYYKNDKALAVKMGDSVVVKSDIGYDIGLVSIKGELVRLQLRRKKITPQKLLNILRIPSQIDLDRWHKAIALERQTTLEARKIIKALNLKMKMTDVEIQADGRGGVFYYIADNRIDFRELVKVLSKKFKMKILLKQVGVRQEAGIIGGLGSCGRELCCASWLTDTRAVSISAARYQNLSLNPQKLTGQCGKLKCCLNYELENYMEALKGFPNTKILIKTKRGQASVQKIDIFKKIIWYSYIDKHQNWFKVSVEGVNKMLELNKGGKQDFLIEDFMENK